jgi:hypothetical protein
MWSRLGIGRAQIPNLVVAQRVIERMRAASKAFIEDETGEAMVGLLIPGTHTGGIPTLYALDTISPDESAVRMMHTFQQGDARQDELIWWLQENWHLSRHEFQKRGDKWDVPLRYLGDWHKQPGFMIQPSGGDLLTALDWIDDADNRCDFLLAPILTLDHPLTTEPVSGIVNFLTVPQEDGESALRVDFWYIDKRVKGFLPISPVIYPDDQLPTLAPYPWHLVDEARFNDEYERLKGDGLFSALVLWDADGALPLEVCFLIARAGSDKMLIVVTSHDYPAQPPRLRIAPFVSMGDDQQMYDVFKRAWSGSQAVDLPLTWTPDLRLLDALRAVEEAHGLRTEESS